MFYFLSDFIAAPVFLGDFENSVKSINASKIVMILRNYESFIRSFLSKVLDYA